MRLIKFVIYFGLICFIAVSCGNTLHCESHFIPVGYTGRVTVYYDQIKRQKKIDKNGCFVFDVSEKGECFSAFSYKAGTAVPNETLRFFEKNNRDKMNEIFEFRESEYLKDTINNKSKKYIFILFSGYKAPNYVFMYDVDYGANYKNHLYY